MSKKTKPKSRKEYDQMKRSKTNDKKPALASEKKSTTANEKKPIMANEKKLKLNTGNIIEKCKKLIRKND